MSKRATPKGRGKEAAGRNTMRWVTYGVLIAAAAFGLLGGEYSTFDWFDLRRQKVDETERVTELTRAVDSLERAVNLLENDPREQERVAREAFGMIREGEHLYRILPKEAGER